MTLKPMEAHYNTLTNTDIVRILNNTEGKTEFERGLILEAARRIEAQDAAIAAAVQAEREACKRDAANAIMRIKTSTTSARNMTLAEFRSVCSCAAEDAIRARGSDTK